MKSMMLSLGAALSLLVLPTALQAQVPVVLICQDGTSQPGSSKVACGDHGGMDWEATKRWTEMRAGHYAAADTVVCTDGQARAAGAGVCAGHGGVDSVSTLAAVKRRAKAYRFADRSERTTSEGGTVAEGVSADSAKQSAAKTREDSLKWGYPTAPEAGIQNPPGYRGMERAVETFPPDSAETADSAASAAATDRVGQMQRQDSLQSQRDQNPPGYRGMERPAGLDSARAAVDSAGASVESAGEAVDSMPAGTGMKSERDTTEGKQMPASEKDSASCKCE